MKTKKKDLKSSKKGTTSLQRRENNTNDKIFLIKNLGDQKEVVHQNSIPNKNVLQE